MPYTLPAAVDVYWKTFAVPAAQIPAGANATRGFPFLQFNQHRVGLVLINAVGGGSEVWISEREFGFSSAIPLFSSLGPWHVTFPPRIQLFAWQTGPAPDFRYLEMVYQPFRQGVSPESGGGIRSNVQNA